MTGDELWELFCETGDPLCWLALRGAERPEAEDTAAAG